MGSSKLTCSAPNKIDRIYSALLYRKNYSHLKYTHPLSERQTALLESLRNDGFIILPNYIAKETLNHLKKEFQEGLNNLQFNIPVLAQSKIDPVRHKELIDNFLYGTNTQLENWGVLLNRDEISSYDQVVSDFSPSTLTIPMLGLSETYRKVWLDPFILNIVCHYLGMVPSLAEAYVRRNFPAKYRTMNHYWHRDLNSKYLLKAFVFLSDCETENGPHEYIAQTHKRFDILNGKRYFSDQEVDDVFPPTHALRQSSIVKAGTIIIEDTHGLHRAGLPTAGWRDLGYMVFMPLRPFYAHKNYCFPRSQLSQLSPLQNAFIHPAMLS